MDKASLGSSVIRLLGSSILLILTLINVLFFCKKRRRPNRSTSPTNTAMQQESIMPKKNGKITQADLNQYESRVPNQAFMKLDDDNYGLKSDAKNPSPSAVNTATPLQKQSFEVPHQQTHAGALQTGRPT